MRLSVFEKLIANNKIANNKNNIFGIYFTIHHENKDGKEYKYLRQDGEDEYKGTEFSFNGKLSPKWNVMGGVMYLDAKHNKSATKKSYLNGTRVSGASEWNGVLTLEYAANDQLAAFGRLVYNGSAYIWNGNSNQLKVPSYTTVDMGLRYKTKLS